MSVVRSSRPQPGARARLRLFALVMLLITALLPLSLVAPTPAPAGASSHREAPLIAEDKVADGTDVYAFTSPDKTDTVTLVANYVPLQPPAGGPNFDKFGDDVQYDINIDSNGDANVDVTFRFNFTTTTVNPNTFLYNVGPMSYDPTPTPGNPNGTYKNWNRPQTYTLTVIKNGVPTVLGSNLLTPPVNVGPNSAPNYPALAAAAIKSGIALPGGGTLTAFAGQRDDPFFVDLGRTFDLLGVNPAGGTDFVGGFSVNSLILQVPKSFLQGANGPVIGVWSTSSRQTMTVLDGNGGKTGNGAYTQVSRLGMPLVNEAVVPLGKKDQFNATEITPTSDGGFLPFVTDPELARLFVALGVDKDTPTTNRNDLVAVFLTGVPGINQPPGVTASEMLRLNMSTAPSTTDPNTVNRMGVLGGQLDGFPNGRRLADDVADIELQVVAGILCQTGGALAGPAPCRTSKVNTALGDGVNANDLPFQTVFPYLANPRPPYGDGSTPPTVPSYSATVTVGGNGTVTNGSDGKVIANGASISQGGVVSFAATPAANNVFLGWTVDGSFVGFANPLKLSLSKNRTVRADFAPRPTFADVPTTNPAYEAVIQLAARGFIRGTSSTTFAPSSPVLRAQAAALVGRTLDFTSAPSNGNPFPDRCASANSGNCVDDELWGYVASLAANGIAKGYPDMATCKAAGTTAACYLPRNPVLGVQVVSFITRAFVAKGYWVQETTDTGIYSNVPANTGERLDLVTFVKNAGDLPGLPSSGAFTGYDQAATRGFFARALFQAYSVYFGLNRIPTP